MRARLCGFNQLSALLKTSKYARANAFDDLDETSKTIILITKLDAILLGKWSFFLIVSEVLYYDELQRFIYEKLFIEKFGKPDILSRLRQLG